MSSALMSYARMYSEMEMGDVTLEEIRAYSSDTPHFSWEPAPGNPNQVDDTE